jgi:hypothetical protein
MNQCVACKKFLSPKDAATCAKCSKFFHTECVGIAGVVPNNWACPECKAKIRKSDNSGTPVKSLGEGQASAAAATSAGPAPRPPTKETELVALRRDLNQYMAEQRLFREEMRTSLLSMAKRMDTLEQRLDAVEKRAVEPMMVPGSAEVDELKRTVEHLQRELNDRDQDVLLADLDIGHVPEVRGENVVHTVAVLAAKLGVALDQRDIVFAERVGALDRGGASAGAEDGGAASRPRRLIVRLARRQLRDELLRAARVRRTLTSADVDLPGPPRRIYFNERLTRSNRLLFHRAREEGGKRQWRFVWTKRGRVYARQSDGKQAYSIRSEADMERVFGVSSVCDRS